MQIKNRINLKIFIPTSLLTTAATCYFAAEPKVIAVTIFVYVAALVNLYMLSNLAMAILETGAGKKLEKKKLVTTILLKLLILFGAIIIGGLIIGNKIIIPVLNYIIQIIVLSVSAHLVKK